MRIENGDGCNGQLSGPEAGRNLTSDDGSSCQLELVSEGVLMLAVAVVLPC